MNLAPLLDSEIIYKAYNDMRIQPQVDAEKAIATKPIKTLKIISTITNCGYGDNTFQISTKLSIKCLQQIATALKTNTTMTTLIIECQPLLILSDPTEGIATLLQAIVNNDSLSIEKIVIPPEFFQEKSCYYETAMSLFEKVRNKRIPKEKLEVLEPIKPKDDEKEPELCVGKGLETRVDNFVQAPGGPRVDNFVQAPVPAFKKLKRFFLNKKSL